MDMESMVEVCLVLTESELQLLKTTTEFKLKNAYKGLIWNVSKTNTHSS